MFAIGTRFNDRITGKVEKFAPDAVVIHIDIDAACISRNITADIPIVSGARMAIDALLEQAKPLDIWEWRDEITCLKKKFPITMKGSGLTSQKKIQIRKGLPQSLKGYDSNSYSLFSCGNYRMK